MVLGGGVTQRLFQVIDIDVTGQEKLRKLRRELGLTDKQAQSTGSGMGQVAGSTDDANQSAQGANQTFGKMFGVGMNLMFMGMALQKMFGGLAKSILKVTGTSKVFGAAAKSTLLPFFIQISPLLNKIAFFFMNLSKPIKMVIGAFTALMAVMATFLFFGAQVGIMAATISGSFAALSASILVIVAGLGIISVALAGLVLLFDKGSRALGALMVVLSAAGAAMYAFGLRAAFAKGMLGPLNAALSSVLGFFGGISTSAGFLKSGLTFLGKTFVKFAAKLAAVVAPILASVAAIFKAFLLAIAPVLVVIAGLVAGFVLVNKILKQFSGVMKKIVGVVIVIVAAIIAVIASAPIIIAAAIGAIIAVIWNFKDEIWGALTTAAKIVGNFIGDVVDWFKKLPGRVSRGIGNFVDSAVGFFKDLYKRGKGFVGNLIDFITSIPSKIASGLGNLSGTMMDVGKDIVNGVIDGLKAIGGTIADVFMSLLPDPLAAAIKQVGSGVGNLIQGVKNVLKPDDFILTSGGKMIQPASNDTIVGFNGNGPIQPGAGGGGNVTVNINDPVMKEDVDVQDVVDEVEERVNRDTRGRTGGL